MCSCIEEHWQSRCEHPIDKSKSAFDMRTTEKTIRNLNVMVVGTVVDEETYRYVIDIMKTDRMTKEKNDTTEEGERKRRAQFNHELSLVSSH